MSKSIQVIHITTSDCSRILGIYVSFPEKTVNVQRLCHLGTAEHIGTPFTPKH